MAIVIKNTEQIIGIRESSVLAAKTIDYLEQFLVPGNTTAYIDQKCEEFIRDHGAVAATKGYKGYPASSCLSPNDVICHGVPGAYVLRDGDILKVDVTTILNGYYGDTCRAYEIGNVSDYAKKLVKVTKECMRIGIKQCTTDNFLGNVGYEINKYATSFGYSVVKEFCGHGVGLKFHEDPEVSHVDEKNTGPKLKPGMIFTIEPMINAGKFRVKIDKRDGWTARTIDGRLSAQWEHTILVTNGKPVALTDIHGDMDDVCQTFDAYIASVQASV